jgi:streptogramin lyase
LAAQRSFIMGAVHDGIVVDDDGSAIVTSLTDLQAVLIDPSTNEVQVEIFIAS